VDITFGAQLGYVLKLLAIGRRTNGTISLRVHPTFVPAGGPLATVNGADNAVLVTGHAVGDTFYVGPGAGEMPTASSIVADIIDAAIGRATLTASRMAWLAGRREALRVLPMAETRSRFYLRFCVQDKPGVLAAIAGLLGDHDISIASVLQHEPVRPDAVSLMITTHEAREGDLADALEKIRALETVIGPGVRIRVLDSTREGCA
jgi:homoserine dehydrogenase